MTYFFLSIQLKYTYISNVYLNNHGLLYQLYEGEISMKIMTMKWFAWWGSVLFFCCAFSSVVGVVHPNRITLDSSVVDSPLFTVRSTTALEKSFDAGESSYLSKNTSSDLFFPEKVVSSDFFYRISSVFEKVKQYGRYQLLYFQSKNMDETNFFIFLDQFLNGSGSSDSLCISNGSMPFDRLRKLLAAISYFISMMVYYFGISILLFFTVHVPTCFCFPYTFICYTSHCYTSSNSCTHDCKIDLERDMSNFV
jgi:hypothetical protein